MLKTFTRKILDKVLPRINVPDSLPPGSIVIMKPPEGCPYNVKFVDYIVGTQHASDEE